LKRTYSADFLREIGGKYGYDFAADVSETGESQSGGFAKFVAALTHSPSQDERLFGLDVAIRLGHPGIAEIAERLLDDGDILVRELACRVLGDTADPRLTTRFCLLLREEPDPATRLIVATALGRWGTEEAIPALLACEEADEGADYEGRTVRQAAYDALVEIGVRLGCYPADADRYR
jgi:HEAT repeat protein